MEVREMVNYQFDHVKILFVPRSCNAIAHDILILLVIVWVGTRITFSFTLIPSRNL
jgi:hypothetical protein